MPSRAPTFILAIFHILRHIFEGIYNALPKYVLRNLYKKRSKFMWVFSSIKDSEINDVKLTSARAYLIPKPPKN